MIAMHQYEIPAIRDDQSVGVLMRHWEMDFRQRAPTETPEEAATQPMCQVTTTVPESGIQAEQTPIAALPESCLELIRPKTSVVAPTVGTIYEEAILQQWRPEDQGHLVWVRGSDTSFARSGSYSRRASAAV
jgi:hypothetical protein